jgi:hypothetical protein
MKGGPTEGRFTGFEFRRRCGGTYGDKGEAGEGDEGEAGGEACEVRGICLPAAISSCRSSARNWAGVIRRIIGGGEDDLEDKGLEDGDKGANL